MLADLAVSERAERVLRQWSSHKAAAFMRRDLKMAVDALSRQREEIARLNAALDEARSMLDPPICRRQFPDGTVPGNIIECAEGWKAAYDAARQRLAYPQAWQVCATHGAPDPNAWDCPECVRELREEIARLNAALDEARRYKDAAVALREAAYRVAEQRETAMLAERRKAAEARAAAIEAAARSIDELAQSGLSLSSRAILRMAATRVRALATPERAAEEERR